MEEKESDRIKRSDHDALIRVESKVDNIQEQLNKLTDGITEKINDHEIRLRRIETDHERIGGAINANNRLSVVEQQVHDFNLRWKFVVGIAGASGALITLLATIIGLATNVLHFSGR